MPAAAEAKLCMVDRGEGLAGGEAACVSETGSGAGAMEAAAAAATKCGAGRCDADGSRGGAAGAAGEGTREVVGRRRAGNERRCVARIENCR